MILYPAIDLKGGQCVRLFKGDMEQATVFNDSPADQAARFAIRPDSAICGLTAGVAKMPVRIPSFLLSPTANDDPHDAAICGFHMGCGLIIRRLKKKGPKKGPGKGPTRQSDHARCRFAAQQPLQRNTFRVGRRVSCFTT